MILIERVVSAKENLKGQFGRLQEIVFKKDFTFRKLPMIKTSGNLRILVLFVREAVSFKVLHKWTVFYRNCSYATL